MEGEKVQHDYPNFNMSILGNINVLKHKLVSRFLFLQYWARVSVFEVEVEERQELYWLIDTIFLNVCTDVRLYMRNIILSCR